MKRNFFALMAALTFGFYAHAQSAFEKGTTIIDAGVGFGSPYWSSGYKNSLPVNPRVSFERGITDQISAGGTLAYSSSKYDYGYPYNYVLKFRGIFIGGRGAYHFKVMDKLDPYAGVSAGYVIVNVSDNAGSSYTAATGSGFGYGAFAGARYYFASKLGVNAELGYSSFSFLSLGVSFKL